MRFSPPKFSLVLLLSMLSMVPVVTGRLGHKQPPSQDLDNKAKRKLAASRYLSVDDNSLLIEGEYIIKFEDNVVLNQGIAIVEDWLVDFPGAGIIAEYKDVFHGVAVDGVPKGDMMDFLMDNLDVLSMVYEDSLVHPSSTTSWGLDRIDQRDLPLDNAPFVPSNNLKGTGVDIYILDTGVDISHPEFAGRISAGVDVTGEDRIGEDPNGHGTHVAGTAAGATFGVAPGANIIPVKVCDSTGWGSWAWGIAGIEWVVQQHKENSSENTKKSIINLSLGGLTATIAGSVRKDIDQVLKAATDAGVVLVAAAGNDDKDACQATPAFSTFTVTVANSDKQDKRTDTSNWGSCIDLFAPGTDIISAKPGGGSTTLSGTSVSAPFVTGAAALLLQENPTYSPAEVKSKLIENASDGKISDVKGSPNKLLHVP